MSVESLIPMVNRWLEGVHSAMAIRSASQDESSEDEIEDEEDEELSSPTSDKTPSPTAFPQAGHDRDNRKSFKSRFFKRTKDKYIDYNDNVPDNPADLLPNITSKRSLSTEDLPRNLERYSGHYAHNDFSSHEPYFRYGNSKRESFDSTVAQRPFSPCSTLDVSDQFSVCEEDIVLMSPRFRGLTSQRRASDGMVRRIPVQWSMQDPTQGLSNSSTDVNGNSSSRASSRPGTPVTPTPSPFIKIKASGGFKLPPLNAPARRPKLQELPSITVSDRSGSGSPPESLESFPDDQPPCASSKLPDQTYLNPLQAKSLSAVKNAKHLLQRRRGSLPTVMSAIRHSALPIVKEEHPHPEEGHKKPVPSSDKRVNLQIPRHRVRSKSLDGQLGTTSEWEQYKARAMERRAQLP